MTKKYLYLTKKGWVVPWIEGGEVPLNPARQYLSDRRDGVLTTDEGTIRSTRGISDRDFEHLVEIGPDCTVNIQIGRVVIDGEVRGNNVQHVQYPHDVLVLCLCNRFDSTIAERLGKEACVEIQDIEILKENIDGQLGTIGKAKNCEYTRSSDRNHFLKSIEDSWQKEFRIIWAVLEPKSIKICIPKGSAKCIYPRPTAFS